ncbi:MAG: sugar kinase [Anaerolineae bacterium]
MPEPRHDVTGIGEVMLRLSVPVGRRLETTHRLDVAPGGSEGNVAYALARLGRRTAWVSALPTNPLGRIIANHLQGAGVNLDGVVWSSTGRVGTYYVEFSAPPRPIQVVYDRADSCISKLRPDQINWPAFLNTRVIHISGITPALSPSCRAITEQTIAQARAAGVKVSFDVNYRQKLWTEAKAREVLEPLIRGADLLLCSQIDARRVFECKGTTEETVMQLVERTGVRNVVVSCGDQGARAWDGAQMLSDQALPVHIVDRLGAGDALAAGVLHGWLNGSLAQGLRYGVVLAALALSQFGDMVDTTPDEVESLVARVTGGVIR